MCLCAHTQDCDLLVVDLLYSSRERKDEKRKKKRLRKPEVFQSKTYLRKREAYMMSLVGWGFFLICPICSQLRFGCKVVPTNLHQSQNVSFRYHNG